jgi:hypothetical protein
MVKALDSKRPIREADINDVFQSHISNGMIPYQFRGQPLRI